MRSFNRMSLEERWRFVECENLKGTPWHLKELRAAVARQPTPAGGEGSTSSDHSRNPWRTAQAGVVCVRGYVERLGATDGCIACTNLILGNRATLTRDECKTGQEKDGA